MRRFLRCITVAFLCGILVVPVVDAQSRSDNRGRRSERMENRSSRNVTRDRGNRSDRATSNRSSERKNSKNNSRQDNNRRADNRKANNNRPNTSNHRLNDNRQRPNHQQQRRDTRPRHNRVEQPRHHHHVAPPPRPHRLPKRAYHRPVPPPAFRPHHGCPVLRGILGLTFGTAFNLSLDYLYRNGFVVDGYVNDVVYLRNVSQMSFVWPDVELYYVSGGFTGSRFSYSTSYYDRTRYNQLYSTFVTQYGSPVNYKAVNNGYIATWFGYDNGYISLEFAPSYSSDGHLRYYTTLSFGN